MPLWLALLPSTNTLLFFRFSLKSSIEFFATFLSEVTDILFHAAECREHGFRSLWHLIGEVLLFADVLFEVKQLNKILVDPLDDFVVAFN